MMVDLVNHLDELRNSAGKVEALVAVTVDSFDDLWPERSGPARHRATGASVRRHPRGHDADGAHGRPLPDLSRRRPARERGNDWSGETT